jgi:hypothetical protein
VLPVVVERSVVVVDGANPEVVDDESPALVGAVGSSSGISVVLDDEPTVISSGGPQHTRIRQVRWTG